MQRYLKPAVFLLCLAPFAWLLKGALTGGLGPDPAEVIMASTGEWAARMLILTLLVTPLRQWTRWSMLMRFRRMLGLFVFFYASVHLLAFGHFYAGWLLSLLLEELSERPYIAVGSLAWLMLLPLALTSTGAMQRRLGRHWRSLHRLVYPVAALVSLHILWQVRSDSGEAIVYTAVFAALLGWRMMRARTRSGRAVAGQQVPGS